MSDFTTTPDYFDSRDVQERLAELDELTTELEEDPDGNYDELIDLRDEMSALSDFARDADTVSDWDYGVTFVRDDHFVGYVRELLSDTGYLPDGLPEWIVIDWEKTADNVKIDYTNYTFRGKTYWAHS